MTHDAHESLPGYDPRQIWFDGCEECEQRGKQPSAYLGTLDTENFKRAWARAYEWNRTNGEDVGKVSNAERPLLDLLYSIQNILNRYFKIPMGTLPLVEP